eukprot:SAG31_NODE_351_length_17237_cov_7.010445_10_plen_194_part_00
MVQGAPPSFSCVYTNKGRGEFRLRRSALHYDTDTRKRDSKLAEPTARNVATPSTRAHQVATKQWQQQAAVMSDSGSIGSFRSARGTRSRPRAYDPVKYRTEAAVREGRAVEDEGYYSARLAIQASIKEHEKQQAAQRWEKVKPWLEAKASPRSGQRYCSRNPIMGARHDAFRRLTDRQQCSGICERHARSWQA